MKSLYTCFSRGRKGFTLLEILIALVLMAVSAGILLPRFHSFYENAARGRFLDRLENKIRYVHYQAVMQRKNYLLRCEDRANACEVLQKASGLNTWEPAPGNWTRKETFPSSMTLRFSGKPEILFSPDGTISRATITVKQREETAAVIYTGETLKGIRVEKKLS